MEKSEGQSFGAILTDLSKAFDCLFHDFLLAKLEAFGFDINSLRLIYNYLNSRKQCVKIADNFSLFEEILFGVPQGSILGPLLFNIFICDLFLLNKNVDIASYADDNTPYAQADSIDGVIEKLETSAKDIFTWFRNNGMKANTDKCHRLLSDKGGHVADINNVKITNNEHVKLLGITFDNLLKFDKHVSGICNRASQKLYALARVACFMSMDKRRLIIKSFINSQFGYCPLIWMSIMMMINMAEHQIIELIIFTKGP